MKRITGILAAAIAAAILTACAAGDGPAAQTVPAGASAARHGLSIQPRAKRNGPTLYVLNLEKSGLNVIPVVSVYLDGGATFLRSFDLGKNGGSEIGFATDGAGHFYGSAGNHDTRGRLRIYSERGSKVIRSLHQRKAFSYVTLDPTGNLYTACGNVVCEFAGAQQRVTRKITKLDGPLALDSSGDVAGINCGSHGGRANNIICVFAPGETQPYWTLTSEINYRRVALAFDPSGNLYVAIIGNSPPGIVEVYAPGASSPTRTISNGINAPAALAVDGSGDLYVFNGGSVTVYAPGGSDPIRTITQGVDGDSYGGALGVDQGLALDSAGNLYVANSASPYGPGSVTVYAPGNDDPIRTVTQEIQNPIAVAVGP